jgi:ATP-binding cassette subfamily B protein
MKNSTTKTLPKTLWKFFWYFIKKQWVTMVFMQIFFFAWAIDHTLYPYVLQLVIDAITSFQGDRANVWPALVTPLIFGASLWIGLEICYRCGGFLQAKAIPKFEADIRTEMYDYVSKHSHVYFSTNMAGSLSNKISDMPQSMSNVLRLVMSLFIPVALAMIIAAGMFFHLSPPFAYILIGWLVVHLSIAFGFAGKCDQYSNIHSEARNTLSGKIVDSFSNQSNVKLFAQNTYEKNYLAKYQRDEQVKHKKTLKFIELTKLGMGIASFLGPGIAMNWYMIYSWQQGYITSGEVVYVFNTTWNITMMAWLLGMEIPNLFKEIGVCRQALTIIQDPHDIVDDENAMPLKVKNGEIVFENVTFNYTPNRNIFENKNIIIEAGSRVGLVGFSGSGKSTFVNLILRYFDVEQGRILIDGQDISKVTQSSLRSQIGMIPQDTSLFHRTLMENIRYGNPNASDEEVVIASKAAHCHEFIEQIPEGYNALAGERGIKLSGGQRQRIAIARAILKNAPILILDEATSALDSVTEKNIQDSLQYLMLDRTCIVIAHRLSTLSGMDRILVFKDGEIIEDGTHSELIKHQGHYATMWNMQAGGFLPE